MAISASRKADAVTPVRVLHELDEGELAGSIDRDVKMELALGGPDLGDVDVEPQATPTGRQLGRVDKGQPQRD